MESLLREEKLVRIEAHRTDISAVRRGRMMVMTVCFDTHIELAWTEMSQTVC